jgi:hypothetical protein
MRISRLIILTFGVVSIFSCRQELRTEVTFYDYYNKTEADTTRQGVLIAISHEEYLQYGSPVAYVNIKGDTIIPFGKYAYLGTDTLTHFGNVIEYPKDSSYGRWIAIDRNEKPLYEIVSFDNGPDYFKEGLVRVKRNGKMGFANEFGQVVIPCKYDFVWWFEDGKAKVTYKAREVRDKYDEEHSRIESDDWFYIDQVGKEMK